jgi:crotonobetainyl-CoA:carnitine CoA-transferase CaiB-like acyl-CoA transferase
MSRSLENIRILDLTHMLSGPYGAMILADLGAETIKIEPLQGEGTRKLLAKDPKNSLDGMGAYYITLNRNKKSVAIDLKSEDGLAVFYELVRESDVVISNFGVGVPERLKIDYNTLKKINSRVITCTVTGFGSDGPNPKRPAFDQVAQATGGGMSITGTDPDHPVRSGIPTGDLGGGMFAVMGILTALLERRVAKASTWIFRWWTARFPCSITWRPCISCPARTLTPSATRTLCMCRTIPFTLQTDSSSSL